jgi:hypothetical protein
MKKTFVLLTVTFFLASTTFANVDMDREDANFYSTNAKAITQNDDGSFTIILPKFKNPTGEGDIQISTASDMNGVCKLYGFESSVLTTDSLLVTTVGNWVYGVVIGPSGKLTHVSRVQGEFRSSGGPEGDTYYSAGGLRVIQTIVCSGDNRHDQALQK